ncbi:Calx-beta domain-containing protein [Neorhodopirellula pilleata]|uniref:Calx-beta domain protein n=1 Tax=Neorhodopirellula pilleata TaxID=2714738 RepID=A0A5C6A8A3_9BACT|nr:Calx-beta domain-containing protein [Neorhodopirellula pilleata]TWT95528.1 Calx-beta domain protein [Neorhodopirellula pilleata]
MVFSRRFLARRRSSPRRDGRKQSGVSRKRADLQFQALESRQMLDGFGVRLAFFPTTGGSEVDSLRAGESYVMRTFVQDQRPAAGANTPSGIRQAVFDIPFDSSLLQFTGPITLGSEFQTVPGRPNSGEITPGRLDNLNGRDRVEPTGAARAEEILFFEINVTALAPGSVDLDVVNATEPNLRAEYYFPLGEVSEFDVTGDQIQIVGSGVVLTGAGNLQVAEGGAGATFQVALNRQPSQPVSFNITPQTSGRVSLSRTSLSFTPANWNTPQTVQITAVDDLVDRGMTTVTLVTSNLQSSDTAFNGVSVDDINVTVTDDDFAGITFNPSFGFVTNEDLGTATTQVTLDTQPTANVTVNFTSTDITEGIVSPNQLIFTPSNWNQPRTLTITGVNDDDVDGQQSYAIIGSIVTTDTQYNNVAVPTLSILNNDNDVIDFLVEPNAGLITGESITAGGSDTFNVRLRSRPNSNVVFNIATSDATEGTPSVSTLTFTPNNWNQTQTVTVNGVDDQMVDGPVAYQITVTPNSSSDPAYRSLPAKSVMVTNQDDDVANLIVSAPNRTFTTEGGGTATFTTRLQTPPTGTVTVNVVSSDTTEGTISPAQLTFTSTNWNQPQTITVTGANDSTIDGSVNYNVNLNSVSNSDPAYNNLSRSISLNNQDDDVPGLTFTGIDSLITNENGGTDSFTIALSAQPTANVIVRLASSNTNEVTVAPTSLTFTPANWNNAQTVTLSGVNDNTIDGDQTANITFDFSTSPDNAYRDFVRSPLTVTNQGDQARLLVQPLTGLITSEAPGNDQSDTFSVRLTRQPTTNVFVTVVSSDTGEGTPDTAQLTFTPQNFDQPQTVTVTGVNDDTTDGNQAYQVTLTTTQASDVAYRGLNPTTVMLTNLDDDVPSLVVGAANPGNTTEAGGTSQIAVRLQTQPMGTVQVTAVSNNTGEGIVSGSPLTFNATNWNQNQFITITGVNDERVDGNVSYQITLTPSSTTDAGYNSPALARMVSLTNTNDDVAALELTGIADLRTDESGSTDSFSVRLQKQPLGNVTIALASSNTNEVTVGPTTLNFTPANWNQNQTVTLTGVDDGLVVDGNRTANITFNLSQSADAGYANLSVDPLVVTNVDNDVPAVNVAAADPIVVSETGTTGTFTITLATPPTQPVTITAISQDTSEALVSPATVTFTAANFDQPQSFTVTGVDDQLVDEDVLSSIVISATSADTAYNAISIDPVRVRTLNDDVGNVRVIAADDLTTSESGTAVTFEVSLAKQPTENVSVPISVSDATELSIDVNTPLVFTPSNWNVPQTITVTGLADARVDADVVSQVQLGPTTSTDADFNNLDVAPVSVTNTNVDTAAIVVTGTDVVEGNPGGTSVLQFTIRLNGAVESGLSLNYSAIAATSGVPATPGTDFNPTSGTATFNGVDGETMTISVPIVADEIVESNEGVSLRVTNLVANGNGVELTDVSLPSIDATARILNDDTATITLAAGAAVFEGDTNGQSSITSTVSLSAAVQGGVTVEFATTDDSATIAGNDYVASNETLSLGGNDPLTRTISVSIIGDETPEPDESFNLTLSNLMATDDVIRNAITIVNSPAPLTILNDDAPRLILRNITTNNTEGDAGGSRTFRFEVELTDAVDDADGFSIPITTVNGTANAASDYTAVSSILNFSGAAEETRTIDVVISGDDVVENDETFVVRLGSITGLAQDLQVVVPTPEISATIANDDTASIRLVASETTVTEGTAGTTSTITFTATLEGDVDSGFQIGYATTDGTATVGDADYIAANGSLTFTGQSDETQTFSVVVNGDSRLETNETFAVALGELTGLSTTIAGSITRPVAPIDITILADDRATLSIQDAAAVNEGGANASNELVFAVSLSAPVDNAFSLAFATNDTGASSSATAGSDYVSTSGQLTFAANSTATQTIRVPVLGDAMVEPNEVVGMTLGDLTGLPAGLADFIDIERSVATGEIQNDDSATLSIQGPTGASEPGGPGSTTSLTYTVSLSAPVQGGVSIAYTTSDGTATSVASARDYTAASGVLTFDESGSLQRTFTVDVRGDSSIENDESFTVRLGELSNVSSGLATSITVADQPITTTIADDDSITVSFANSASTVAETDGTHEVSVVLTTTGGAILEEPLSVDVIVRSSSSAGSGDFTISTMRVTFPAGSSNGSSQVVRIVLNDEGTAEPTETIVLGLQSVGNNNGVSVGGTDHTVSVTDDPRDATISGFVWADTDGSRTKEAHEMPIAGITIRLTGTDRKGETVSRQTITDATGRYEFDNLAAGTYAVSQDQPAAFHDGIAISPATSAATVATNRISGIAVAPSQQLDGHHFTERGYRAASIPVNAFMARKSSVNTTTASSSGSSSPLDDIFANW